MSTHSDGIDPNPWWKKVEGPLPHWQGPVGVKEDGGGSTRGRGLVGKMRVHRAVMCRDSDLIVQLIDEGEDVNEVEASGCTPLHNAACDGWVEGAELLLQLGAKINATNNAGDSPWHWAMYHKQEAMMDFLVKNGANKQQGLVLVPDHVNKVSDFYEKPCWAHHPKPHDEYVALKKMEEEAHEKEMKSMIPGFTA